MPCPIQSGENAELLLAYCARTLDPDTRAVLERHMQECPECRAFAEQQKLVWEALDSWKASPVSEDFDARLLQRIEQARRSRRWTAPPGWSRLRIPLAAASMLLAAVLLLRSPSPPPPPETEETGVVEVESVETALEDIEMLRALQLIARADAPVPAGM